MISRIQFEQSLDRYLTSGDRKFITPYLHSDGILVPLLVEALTARIKLIYLSSQGELLNIHNHACLNITNGIWQIIKLVGESGLRALKQILIRDSPLYRNVIALMISAEDKPSEHLLAVIQSLGELPDSWSNEPAPALLSKHFRMIFEKNPYSDLQNRFGYSLDEILYNMDLAAVDFIFQHLDEHHPGDLTEFFLSDHGITKGRALSNISGWHIHPTNIIGDHEVRLFDADIASGLSAPNICIKKVSYKDFNIKNGSLFATASHLLFFDSRSKTAFGFPYREIISIRVAEEITHVAFRDGSNLMITTTYPKPGLIGTLAILGAPPEEKLFHYSIEQDRARTAENFLGMWAGFFNEILDENRRRKSVF